MRDAGAIPLEPYTSSQTKWKCRCKKCKKIIYPSFAPVKNRGISPCQKCAALEMGARRRAKSETASIAILKRAHFVPLEKFPGNSKPWKVQCLKCKKESSPHLSSVKGGSSCGYCAGVKIDESDVRDIYMQAGYEPIGKYPGSTKVLWKAKHKKCGVISSPTFASVKKGGGCRNCSGTLLVSPMAARELFLTNKLEPLEPYKDTQSPWKSKCLVTGKTVSPTYGKVRDFGHRCEYCSRSKVDDGEAIEAMVKGGFKTLAPYPGSNSPWESQCLRCKKVTSPTYSNVIKGIGCKYCGKRAVDPLDAKAAMLKRGFKTIGEFPGATKYWDVICIKCNKPDSIKMHSVNSVSGCSYCARVKLDINDVYKRMEFLEFKPLEKFKTAKTPWRMKCLKCKHIISPTWDKINGQKRGRGCGYCSRVMVDIKDVNRLMKQLKLKPLVKYPGGKNSWKCKCLKCGSIVYPKYGDLSQGQGGCSNCADYGLNYTDKGFIYLITNHSLGAHKIGIANSYKSRAVDDRMYNHKKHGWETYKTKNFTKLRNAFLVEQKIIKWLRLEVGLAIYLSDNQMPQGGWTETVDASEIDLPTIWAKVEELSKNRK
jgi:hypothetical protein